MGVMISPEDIAIRMSEFEEFKDDANDVIEEEPAEEELFAGIEEQPEAESFQDLEPASIQAAAQALSSGVARMDYENVREDQSLVHVGVVPDLLKPQVKEA